MIKKDSKKKIIEDRSIGEVIDFGTKKFETDIRGIIEQTFNNYLDGYPLKKAFFDSIDGGKRLRALSTLIFYNLARGNAKNINQVAAAMELVHCASLVFDDELDKRNTRPDRNIATVRGKYSPEEAMLVIALNVLYSAKCIFDAANGLKEGKRKEITDLFVKTVSEGGLGEVEKWKFMSSRDIPTKDVYWNRLVRSSGALFFRMACKMGAEFATDDKKTIEKIAGIGYKLGQLLQAGDDIKDMKEDMRDGFYSLGVINYYESLTGKRKSDFKNKIKQVLSERELDNIYSGIISSKSIEDTLKEIRTVGNEIINLLNSMPHIKERQMLIRIINYLKDRMRVA